ncbi:uncharacterized protein LOC110466330 [Mizuhopecten yessoensis]|uniref:Uncharacterized protein n=1 Tax=Mizuhopecten yessoensis TaxID=6573 RepID=A0A210PPF1_MIZYE|nr:uncharacterized protein LOC110466330 [Mizuhopecten yessoensis]XP_021378424.1 uncharacterized protein LOC110466330 [Mizuhopecten yessoensis]OWF38379.1 hypothetical protein KP79_PYT10744 [Mizuhopecten yessoensis]
MASRAVFMYPDLDKSAVRALKVEERILELKVINIDVAKRSVALDLRKSQNEMKKRLRKYRDRQREISKVKNSTEPKNQNIEDFMTNNTQHRAFTRSAMRPKTSPAVLTSKSSGNRGGRQSVSQEEEFEVDPSFFTDQQRSKIDLRPSTARVFNGDKAALRKLTRLGSLGRRDEQVRYFDEDELQDRESFYNQMVEWRKSKEINSFESLDYKVGSFCKQSEDEINRRLQRNSCLRQSHHSVMEFRRIKQREQHESLRATTPSSRPNSSGIKTGVDKHTKPVVEVVSKDTNGLHTRAKDTS